MWYDWQKAHPTRVMDYGTSGSRGDLNEELPGFFGNVRETMDSEGSLCVAYAPPSGREIDDQAEPVNMTSAGTQRAVGQMQMSLEQFRNRARDVDRLCG